MMNEISNDDINREHVNRIIYRILYSINENFYDNEDIVANSTARTYSISIDEAKKINVSERVKHYLERVKQVYDVAFIEHDKRIREKLLVEQDEFKRKILESNLGQGKRLLRGLFLDAYAIHEEELNDNIRRQKQGYIQHQKKQLGEWFDFLMSDSLNEYPFWLKVWIFQMVLRIDIGEDGKVKRRRNGTYGPFIDIDEEMQSFVINFMNDVLNSFYEIEKRKQEKNRDWSADEVRGFIQKFNFRERYSHWLMEEQKKIAQQDEGVWVCYHWKSTKDAKRLYESLQNKKCNWCTKSSYDMAHSQICGNGVSPGGDFYVYYSLDEYGKYTNPRIAIRMDRKNVIGEIRGIDDNQKLEDRMIPILERKLNTKEFATVKGCEEALKKVKKLREFLKIKRKIKSDIPLSVDEILSLYVDNYNDFSFRNSEIDKILNSRNLNDDWKQIENHKDLADQVLFLSKIYGHPSLLINKEKAMQLISFDDSCIRFLSEELLEDVDVINLVCSVLEKNSIYLAFLPDNSKKRHPEIALAAFLHSNGCYGIEYLTDEMLEENIDLVKAALEREAYYIETLPDSFNERHPEIALSAFLQSKGSYGVEYLPDEMLEENIDLVKTALEKQEFLLEDLPNSFKKKHPEIALAVFLRFEGRYGIEFLTDEMLEENLGLVKTILEKDAYLMKNLPDSFQKRHFEIVLQVFSDTSGKVGGQYLTDEMLEENLDLVKTALEKRFYLIEFFSPSFLKKHPEIVLDVFLHSRGLCGLEYLSEEMLEENLDLVKIGLENREYLIDYLPDGFLKRHPEIALDIFLHSKGRYGLKYLSNEMLEENLDLVKTALGFKLDNFYSLSSEFKKRHLDVVIDYCKQLDSLFNSENATKNKQSLVKSACFVLVDFPVVMEYLSPNFLAECRFHISSFQDADSKMISDSENEDTNDKKNHF